jgi:hypothetical protein
MLNNSDQNEIILELIKLLDEILDIIRGTQ